VVEIAPLILVPWRIRLTPNHEGLNKGDLVHSENFLNLRMGDFEQTLSTEKDYTRHFFLLPRTAVSANSDTFTISIHHEGGPIEFDDHKRLHFKDGTGKTILVYSRPLIRDSNKQIIAGDFKLVDGKEIAVTFPPNAVYPLALVFGLSSKAVADDVALGLKVTVGESDEGSADSEEENVEKATKKKLKFPDLHSSSLKIGDKRGKRKSWLGGEDKDKKAEFQKV